MVVQNHKLNTETTVYKEYPPWKKIIEQKLFTFLHIYFLLLPTTLQVLRFVTTMKTLVENGPLVQLETPVSTG